MQLGQKDNKIRDLQQELKKFQQSTQQQQQKLV